MLSTFFLIVESFGIFLLQLKELLCIIYTSEWQAVPLAVKMKASRVKERSIRCGWVWFKPGRNYFIHLFQFQYATG